jgi:hypothetical protein
MRSFASSRIVIARSVSEGIGRFALASAVGYEVHGRRI